jgi:hypothetical protein
MQDFVVDQRENLSAEEFAEAYVAQRRPVLVKGALANCSALSRWTLAFVRSNAGVGTIPLKVLGASEIKVTQKKLTDYIDEFEDFEAQHDDLSSCRPAPAYLHDIPLTALFPRADADLENFPWQYFPSWYGKDWAKFAQVFLGPSDSLTPLHFDCLLTHNLFFQIKGRKQFVLIPARQLGLCYPHHWRWCSVDVEKPDFERFPLYRDALRADVMVEPGDALYFPPGTLHHVRSLDCAISFNVDWHTKDSALQGVLAALRGMPLQNVYYNLIVALGLWCKVPARRLFPYYRSYLNYIS